MVIMKDFNDDAKECRKDWQGVVPFESFYLASLQAEPALLALQKYFLPLHLASQDIIPVNGFRDVFAT